jgi:hypothetical protein
MIEFPTLAIATARLAAWSLLFVALLLAGPLLTLALGRVPLHGDWRTATHRSAGLAPDPSTHREAVVQVYASRTFGWRGAFSVHCWLAAKSGGADRYTRYEVIGWYARDGGSSVSITDSGAPDAEWYGAAPTLIRDLRGTDADRVIAKLPEAVASYAFADSYRAWPGPNSNTFLAHLGRQIHELGLALPSNAIGKDYLPLGQIFARTPSGTGLQLSLSGVFGVAAGIDEGLELNVLGLVTGLDLRHPGIKIPGLGRVPG